MYNMSDNSTSSIVEDKYDSAPGNYTLLQHMGNNTIVPNNGIQNGYESNSSVDDRDIYMPPKTRQKKYRKTRRFNLIKYITYKTKKLSIKYKSKYEYT